MTAKEAWGIVMIVISVFVVILGLLSISSTYDEAVQLQALANMTGGYANSIMSGAKSAIEDSYIKSSIITVVGMILSIVGTRLLTKLE